MSLLPYILNELLEDSRSPNIYDQNFGLGLLSDDFPAVRHLAPLRCGYIRPWRNLSAGDSGVSAVQSDSNEFKVNLDVQQFKPEELKVKVADGYVVVDGKHEERSDQHGFISRQFTRRYKVPGDVQLDGLVSNLSSDGVLTLKAPKKPKAIEKGVEIPIIRTNEPASIKKKPATTNAQMEH